MSGQGLTTYELQRCKQNMGSQIQAACPVPLSVTLVVMKQGKFYLHQDVTRSLIWPKVFLESMRLVCAHRVGIKFPVSSPEHTGLLFEMLRLNVGFQVQTVQNHLFPSGFELNS